MVYLIHFVKKLAHARHYVGFTSKSDPSARLVRHKSGGGARILNALNVKNIGYKVVRVWEDGDRVLERQIKNRKNSKHYCPICMKGKERKIC